MKKEYIMKNTLSNKSQHMKQSSLLHKCFLPTMLSENRTKFERSG